MRLLAENASTTERIEAIRELLRLPPEQLRKHKAEVASEWERMIAMLLRDSAPAIEQEFEDCKRLLPARVIAPAVVRVWDELSPSRKKAYTDWISSLDAERAAMHRIPLAIGLFRKDVHAFAAQLLAVSLNNKENVVRFADGLLNQHSQELEAVVSADADMQPYEAHKLITKLVLIAEHERVQPMARYHTLRAVLAILSRYIEESRSLFSDSLDQCARMIRKLPISLQNQLRVDLAEKHLDFCHRLFPQQVETMAACANLARPAPAQDSPSEPGVDEGANNSDRVSSPRLPDPTNELHSVVSRPQGSLREGAQASDAHESWPRRRESIPRPKLLGFFEETVQYIRDLEHECQELREHGASQERELDRLGEELSTARSQCDHAMDRCRLAESRAESLGDHLAELRAELERTQQRSVSERESLLRQVHATAEMSAEQLKNDIGFAVRRVIQDVPDKFANISPETGQRLLVRLHEVLTELERRGVRVRGDA